MLAELQCYQTWSETLPGKYRHGRLKELTLTLGAGGEATGHRWGTGNNVLLARDPNTFIKTSPMSKSCLRQCVTAVTRKQISHSQDSNDGLKERYKKNLRDKHICADEVVCVTGNITQLLRLCCALQTQLQQVFTFLTEQPRVSADKLANLKELPYRSGLYGRSIQWSINQTMYL